MKCLDVGKFWYSVIMYRVWGKVSSIAVNRFMFDYKGNAVEDLKERIYVESLEQISRFATKQAHNYRVQYERIGERIIGDGERTEA